LYDFHLSVEHLPFKGWQVLGDMIRFVKVMCVWATRACGLASSQNFKIDLNHSF